MADFPQTVNAPGAGSFQIPKVDFSWLANLPQQYYQGEQQGHQVAVQNVFKNGLPTVDGSPNGAVDYQAAAREYLTLGMPDQASALLQTGHQLDLQNVFKGGLPKDANGNPDYAAAADLLYRKGDLADAGAMTQTALARQGMGVANDFNQLLMGGSQSGASPTGADPNSPAVTPQSYNAVIAQRESGNNPNVTPNATTGAAGTFGFLPSTWASVSQNHPELNLPPTIAQASPQQQNAAMTALTGDNAKALQTAGIPVTDRTLNMAHFLGAGGATKFFGALKQNPGAPAAALFPKEAAANPTLFYAPGPDGKPGTGAPLSLGQVFQQQAKRFGAGLTAPGLQAQNGAATGPAAPAAASPAGGPTAQDAEGNPVATDASGNAVSSQSRAASGPTRVTNAQTPAALHQANAIVEGKANQPTVAPAAPAPIQAAAPQSQPQPPQPQSAGPGPGQPLDPTLSGLVPEWWRAKGGTPGTYVTLLRSMAAQPWVPAASAASWNKLADGIQQTISRSAAARSGAIAEYEIGHQPGETPDQYAARKASEVAAAEAGVKTANTPVEVTNPDGSKSFVTQKQALDAAGSGQPMQAAQSPASAKGQEAVMQLDQTLGPQFEARQEARQRLQAIGKILETYEPGAFAEEKADLAAAFKGLGIPVSDANMANAASFQEFTKNTIQNVFANIKALGGRPLVAEITGFSKGSANPSLQPAANQAIIGQGMGLLDYEDKRAQDYWDWRQKNPNATSTAGFDLPWLKQNSPDTFVQSATKDVAVKGIPVPTDPSKLTDGQAYVTSKGKQYWSANAGQFSPPAPKVGTVQKGYRYSGGNPNSSTSWQRVQ